MIARLLGECLVFLVRLYQRLLRPVLPAACIYQPSCSEYMVLAVRKYGPIIGGVKGVWRVCRCHPFNAGGEDHP